MESAIAASVPDGGIVTDVTQALDEVERAGGWKAAFRFRAGTDYVARATSVLSHVAGGAPRQGTVLRVLSVPEGVLLLTGGRLTETEGAALFDFRAEHAPLLDLGYVVPPEGSPLMARMRVSGCAPPRLEQLPPLPEPRGFGALVIGFFAAQGFVGRLTGGATGMTTWLIRIALLCCAIASFITFLVVMRRRDSVDRTLERVLARRWLILF